MKILHHTLIALMFCVSVTGTGQVRHNKKDSLVLEEAIVVGMGTQKRNTVTAAVSTVRSEAVVDRPVTDITSVLQGNVAGFNIVTDATESGVGGEPGAAIKFNIRGTGSINAHEPYVIIDGVESNLQNVNPSDVESITVLKDASASAVYGARAAYGVVIVTTRSGRDGPSRVQYRGSIGFSSPINMPEMMSSMDLAAYINELRINTNTNPLFVDSVIEKIEGFSSDPYSERYPGVGVNQTGDGWASAYYNQYADTDWFDYYFKDRAMRHSHSFNVSGGNEKIKYYMGLGYTYQDGLIDHVKDELDKYNINIKLSFQPKSWLEFNLSNNTTITLLERPMAVQTIFYATISDKYPTQAVRLPIDGEYDIPSWNEVMYLKETSFNRTSVSDAISLSMTITPLDGWDIAAEIKGRLDVQNSSFMMGFPKTTLPGGNVVVTSGGRQGYQYPGMHWKNTHFGSYTRGQVFNYYLSPNLSTSYSSVWDKHYFKAMAGFQSELQENSSGYTYKEGMLSEDVFSFANANGVMSGSESRDHWSTMGFYGRINWNWKETIFAEVSGRIDGSSRFAPGYRWGLFPSASVGYDFARADYFNSFNSLFTQLKLRFSYGRLGNQNGAGLYNYIGLMTLNPSHADAWLLPGTSDAPSKGTIAQTPKMVSPYITWEKVDNANAGLDMLVFDNRLALTADVYQRVTRDMIGPAEAIPSIGGIPVAERAKVNNATLRTRGWELSVNWSDYLSGGFSYGMGFNISDHRSVVTQYNNPEGIIYNNHTGLAINRGYYEGMDIGEIWGYEADELFASMEEISMYLAETDLSFFKEADKWRPGDLKFEDNGNGVVGPGAGTLDDHDDLTIIGNATPRYSFGINLSAGYKGFELSTLIQGVAKRDFPMAGSTYLFGGRNYFTDHLNHYSESNPSGWLPRLTDGTGKGDKDWQVNTGYNTSRYLLNAAYARLKNIVVSYSFGERFLAKCHLQKLRVYLSCDNLFTIDSLPDAFDPETINIVNTWAGGSRESAPGLTSVLTQNGNAKVYPLSRTMVLGIDITF